MSVDGLRAVMDDVLEGYATLAALLNQRGTTTIVKFYRERFEEEIKELVERVKR